MNYLIGYIGNTSIKICKLNKKFKIIKSFLFDTKDKYLLSRFKKKTKTMFKGNINKKILAYRKKQTQRVLKSAKLI